MGRLIRNGTVYGTGKGGSGGATDWEDIQNKPTEFPPEAHNHDDLYYGKDDTYSKTEVDALIPDPIIGYGKTLDYDENNSELSLLDENGNTLSTVHIEGGGGEGADLSIISDEWDESKTYAINEYVIYQNGLYKCLADCTNILPTANIYWQKTNVGTELGGSSGSVDVPKHYILTKNSDIEINEHVGIYDVFSYSEYSVDTYICIESQTSAIGITLDMTGSANTVNNGKAYLAHHANIFYVSAQISVQTVLEDKIKAYRDSTGRMYVYIPMRRNRYDITFDSTQTWGTPRLAGVNYIKIGIRTELPTNLTELTMKYNFK